jgi:hypothetical protein
MLVWDWDLARSRRLEILQALAAAHGNVMLAARMIGLPAAVVYRASQPTDEPPPPKLGGAAASAPPGDGAGSPDAIAVNTTRA